MAYKVIILYQLYMPSYFLGTFTEYPNVILVAGEQSVTSSELCAFPICKTTIVSSHDYLINPCFLAPKIIAATHMITPKPFTISDIVVHKFKVLNPEETAAVNV